MDRPSRLRCDEPAAEGLLNTIRRKGRTIVIVREGSEERRLLERFNANANVGGEKLTHIILLSDARKVEALEEFLHGTQFKLGIIQREGLVYAETHVKRFMIRHAKLLRISSKDLDILWRMLGIERP